ncbi:MAG TPA: hypothetical protein DEQ45_10465 [Agrobacterium sp.]|nr:hypothetical protein CFBP6625_05710 [Agrobacterium tumefaciens]HCD84232.1 hypothetical protein [Agrobacterium sp.]
MLPTQKRFQTHNPELKEPPSPCFPLGRTGSPADWKHSGNATIIDATAPLASVADDILVRCGKVQRDEAALKTAS